MPTRCRRWAAEADVDHKVDRRVDLRADRKVDLRADSRWVRRVLPRVVSASARDAILPLAARMLPRVLPPDARRMLPRWDLSRVGLSRAAWLPLS